MGASGAAETLSDEFGARAEGGGLGPWLLVRVSAITNAWIHEQCARWSPEVYETDDGLQVGVCFPLAVLPHLTLSRPTAVDQSAAASGTRLALLQDAPGACEHRHYQHPMLFRPCCYEVASRLLWSCSCVRRWCRRRCGGGAR